jgi:oligopeptide/dipeptide ABC transporter ATP-binding protein
MSGETAIATANDLLRVEDLHIRSRLGGRERRIVTSLSLSVGRGETIGIVGESGSGKSLTARAIMGLLPDGLHASGRVEYGGRNLLEARERELAGLRGTEIGLVFQDPFTMLSPLRRCHRHIDELLRGPSGRRLGRRERRAEAVRRLAEVGIDDPSVADRYPFQLSGGMRQRVAIAIAFLNHPELVICDEPTTALDVSIQAQILVEMKTLVREADVSLIWISHDLATVSVLASRLLVMYAGRLIEQGPTAEVLRRPRHPYTQGLIDSLPSRAPPGRDLVQIPGAPPSLIALPSGCAFKARCTHATSACDTPPAETFEEGRIWRCYNPLNTRIVAELPR